MIGFLMLVGPGEADMAVDSLSVALALYPHSVAWIIDDATSDGTYQRLRAFANNAAGRIFLRRNPSPQEFFGIPVSLFRAFDWLCNEFPEIEMIIKLDPDACILRGGLIEMADRKFAAHGPGVIGSYRIGPDGGRRSNSAHATAILLDLFPFGLDKQYGRLRLGFPFYGKYLARAVRHRYVLGEHALGAFYVLHGDTLRALAACGYWRAIPDSGSRRLKADDPLLAIGVKAVGHALIDIHVPSAKTWLQIRNPIGKTAREIVNAGYLAVHPLKNDMYGRKLRAELRQMLRQNSEQHLWDLPVAR